MLGGLFEAMEKGLGAVAKGIGSGVSKAGSGVSKAGKYTLGKVTDAANKASGYKPNLKGPDPKVETDVYGNTSLSMPKVKDPNSFSGRGGIKGGIKRVLTGDPQAGSEDEGETPPAPGPDKASPKKAATGKLQPPLEYENPEFNPNWRNWKSMPGKTKL